jgi:hypothetical protein
MKQRRRCASREALPHGALLCGPAVRAVVEAEAITVLGRLPGSGLLGVLVPALEAHVQGGQMRSRWVAPGGAVVELVTAADGVRVVVAEQEAAA